MLTVFVGTFNRLDTLERTVRSYERLATPLELVIVDNGTDNQECLDLLAGLEHHSLVRKVYTLGQPEDMDGLAANYNLAIQDQRRRTDLDWLAVTDADISFEDSHPRTLEKYVVLAKATGQAVGCHMRVTDIPAGYPLRSRVLTTETRLVYRRSMNWHQDIPYSTWQIDTTFHLFPATRDFVRLRMNSWRVGPPFDAKHLDWYLNVHAPTLENSIYVRRNAGSRNIGSWGKAWIADYWQTFQSWGAEVAFESLVRAPVNPHGDLCVNSFILSWCYQYGVGTPVDRAESERWLRAAIPRKFTDYWKVDRGIYQGDEDAMWSDWLGFVYRADYRPLGWGVSDGDVEAVPAEKNTAA